jgi:DNA-binding IclR family transcriptional regulator
MKDKLWHELKTPQEKAEYIRSGMAGGKSLIAHAIAEEVAAAFDALAAISEKTAADFDRLKAELEKTKEELESERTEYWL